MVRDSAFDPPGRFALNGAFGFWNIAAQEPGRPAVVTAGGREWTFGELRERCDRIAHALQLLGLKGGDALALLMPNTPDWLAVALAASQMGVYLVPVNRHLTADEFAYLLRNSRAKMLITSTRYADTARAAGLAAGLAADSCLGIGPEPGQGLVNFEAMLAQQPATRLCDRRAGSLMFYSSGTTGRPKGVRRPLFDGSPEALLLRTLPMYSDMFGLRAGAYTHLVATPLYHAAPGSRAIQLLHLGHRLVLMDKWQAEPMLALIEKHRVDSMQLVPIMFHRLLALPAEVRGRYRHDSLRCVIHAAAPCPVATKRRMIKWWGPIIHEYYAASEGGGTYVNSTQWLQRPGTVGQAYSHSSIRILGEDGEVLPQGEVGSVYMRDGQEFEYFDDPVKTAAAKRDGYFTAGDYGYLDAEGWLFICDRRSDLIISGGVNIYPAEIEALLMEHPAVADAAVVGLPDEEWGQRVQALVEPVTNAPAASILRGELQALCAARLANFKRPKDFAFATLPRTDAGKLSRTQLRDRFMAGELGGTTAES